MKNKDIKESDFTFFLEKIKTNENYIFNCKIIEENEDKNLCFKFMSILMNEKKSSKFIRYADNTELRGKAINFKINDVKMRIFKGTFYFLIEKYNIENNLSYKSEKNNIKESEYIFDSIKIYKVIDQIEKKDKHLCSFILKAEEAEEVTETKNLEFRDSKNQLMQIEKDNINYKFENGKIYIFNGFLYNMSNNNFESTIISDIQDYSINCEKIYNSNEICELKLNSLINFQGRIKSFNLSKQYIYVENNENQKYKVNVNFKLLKKNISK